MIFQSWSIAHFVGIITFAVTFACATLPFVFPSISVHSIRRIFFVLAITLSAFIAIVLFYWLAPHFHLPHVEEFPQDNTPLFLCTMIAFQQLLFYAIKHTPDNSFALCCAICSAALLTFVFPLKEDTFLPFFALVMVASFFIDLLLFSSIVQRNYITTIPFSLSSLVALNSIVMLLTSAALHYDTVNVVKYALVLIAVFVAGGIFFSYWRYVSMPHMKSPSLFLIAFQFLLVIHLLTLIPFQEIPPNFQQILLATLLVLCIAFSLEPKKKNPNRKIIRAIATSLITATIAIAIYYPSAREHTQILLLFAILTLAILLHQRQLPDNTIHYGLYVALMIAMMFFYLPILFLYKPTFHTPLWHEYLADPITFFALLALLTLYNAHHFSQSLKAKKTSSFEPQRQSTLGALFLSLGLLHILFIVVPL